MRLKFPLIKQRQAYTLLSDCYLSECLTIILLAGVFPAAWEGIHKGVEGDGS